MPASSQDSLSASRDPSGKALLLSGACALSGWGGPAVRVLPRGGEPCPQEVRNLMFNELGLTEGSEFMIHLDIHQPGSVHHMGVYAPGPIVGRVVHEDRYTERALPEGTLLYGHGADHPARRGERAFPRSSSSSTSSRRSSGLGSSSGRPPMRRP
jgi:hypothetical protein